MRPYQYKGAMILFIVLVSWERLICMPNPRKERFVDYDKDEPVAL